MEHRYNPTTIEAQFSPWWEDLKLSAPSGQGTPYCIMLPPPNVTGSLHMGHGFQLSLMDCLIRYQRMCGRNVLWQAGTDHAGIATQMVVERNLAAKGKDRKSMGREAFLREVWSWKAQSGGTITQQMRRMGASVDWSRERFTMDPDLSHAVRTLFVQLYRDKRIYRGKRLVNWDPKLQTAISDLEIINEERNGNLWHIRYPLSQDANTHIVVATTRPETLFGDMAVAVHPDDTRYQHLIGKTLELPLTGRHIPVIADADVDKDFGSGAVKITPAHDFNDYRMGKKHGLDTLNIMHKDATLNDYVPKKYQGMTREDARIQVIKDLKKLGNMHSIEPHRHAIPVGDRSGVVIEPYLTDQWYVACEGLAKHAMQVVAEGKITFHPENYVNTYNRWLENIEDWCISRQLWWGHRIPAWYDLDGNIYVGLDEAEVRAHYQLPKTLCLSQDPDVLDTWFSSALWPFATLGWPEKTPDLTTFFPTNVLVTGHDILFFWVARMIMMSLYTTGKVPFTDVLVTGLIRDENNQKMSKSKGNIIDPIDLIDGCSLQELLDKRTKGLMQPEQKDSILRNTKKLFPSGMQAFGTDALRFTFCALATTGRDVRFDVKRLEGYRNFCNKLWNASRFVLSQMDQQAPEPSFLMKERHFIDHWILLKLQSTIEKTHTHIANYRLDLLAKTLYDFVWYDFCDWYIELAKYQLQHAETHVQQATRRTLLDVLEQTLKLLHPIIPFITEAIWQHIAKHLQKPAQSIIQTKMPKRANDLVSDNNLVLQDANLIAQAVHRMDIIQQTTRAVRNMRSEMQINPSQSVPLCVGGLCSDASKNLLKRLLPFVQHLAKTQTCTFSSDAQLTGAAKAVVDIATQTGEQTAKSLHISNTVCHNLAAFSCHVYMPLIGLIDIDSEKQRILKNVGKINKQLLGLEKRLNNPGFVKNAPEDVLHEQRALVETLQKQLKSYQTHLDTLNQM